MAAAFKDHDEFFDATLKLPVGGKTYVIPPSSAEVGLLCQRLMQAVRVPNIHPCRSWR
ncbi:DUF7426 family protein [Nonomuraea jiangxiensis]|uniref:DUF7426 domain-containing protein n=1 Tax=Nonomuraea jiangxiensis TaxID=633440 RepID=A0A1G8UK46_9ACTN|nr:hypothetical protein [Nonomuraea jiangxiensis]SDJ53994.1 hypothetical protein SAMN05421869_11110 [Nonomuraea jiangxiensis]